MRMPFHGHGFGNGFACEFLGKDVRKFLVCDERKEDGLGFIRGLGRGEEFRSAFCAKARCQF